MPIHSRWVLKDRIGWRLEYPACVVHKVTITPLSLASLSHFIHEIARETCVMRRIRRAILIEESSEVVPEIFGVC
jgi:hypothetical protein